MGEVRTLTRSETSTYSLIDGLEQKLTRLEDLAEAAEIIVETQLGRDHPAGLLHTLLGLIRQTVQDAEAERLLALQAARAA